VAWSRLVLLTWCNIIGSQTCSAGDLVVCSASRTCSARDLVVRTASQICSAGSWPSAPPRRLPWRGFGHPLRAVYFLDEELGRLLSLTDLLDMGLGRRGGARIMV
jgi:hypothetical protein